MNGGLRGGQSSYKGSCCFHWIAMAFAAAAAAVDGDENVVHGDVVKGGARYYWR